MEDKIPAFASSLRKQRSSKASLLDSCNPTSELNLSSFRGVFNMIFVFGILYMTTKPLTNYIQRGQLFSPILFETFRNDYILCVLIWPLFFIWAFNAFMLEKMIILKLNPTLAFLYQHSTQAGLFIFSIYVILSNEWCASHSAFVVLQACVHFMKMHSYTTVNRDYREESIEASRKGQKPLTNYPSNVTISDFILYMWTPLLVYHNYKRKEKRSWIYIIQKGLLTIMLLFTVYIVHTEYIMPHIEKGSSISFIQLNLLELFPTTVLLLNLFYIVFECLTNLFAEITKLQNRCFYSDWWNSTTFQEFNRKWNKPVHQFMYQHVYLEVMLRWGLRKQAAQLITFTFSALLHEFLFAIIFRIVRPIFLGFILSQVPIIYFTRFMLRKKSGNYFFWYGMIQGPTLIVSCYLRVHQDVTNLFTKFS